MSRRCHFDYGWCGLAGVLALFSSAGVVALFGWYFHLFTSKSWRDLYFYQVVILLTLVIVAVLCAKVLATCVQLLAVFWQVYRYRRLIKEALIDQDQRPEEPEVGVRKVLICHASVGAGHRRAAEAVSATIHRINPAVEVRVVDLMEPPYADRTLIYFYKDWYLRLVGGETLFGGLGGHCVGFLFDRVNSVHDSFTGGNPLQRRVTQSFLLNFLQLVIDFKPDVVVHTHFLAPELLASLRRRHGLRLPHVTVVTDMDVHAWWYQQPTDHYFVPRELARSQLCSDGVPPSDITVSGIPIMPQFQDTLAAVRKLDLPGRRRRFLAAMDTAVDPAIFDDAVSSGAGGSVPSRGPRPLLILMSTGRNVVDLLKHLLCLETPVAVVVVCGRQADVRTKLAGVSVPPRHRVALLGFTRAIHELLAIGDVIVTKPGGLITSEALACGLMMVVVDPYPGQEERNASMLLEEGAGLWVWDNRDLPAKLDPVLSAPHEGRASLRWYRENARRLARPDAAEQVARYVLSGRARLRMLQDVSFVRSRSFGSESDADTSSSGSPATRSIVSWLPGFLQPQACELCGGRETSEEVRHRFVPWRTRRLSMEDLDLLEAADREEHEGPEAACCCLLQAPASPAELGEPLSGVSA